MVTTNCPLHGSQAVYRDEEKTHYSGGGGGGGGGGA